MNGTGIKTVGVILALVVNLFAVIGGAVSIVGKLDTIAFRSTQNCILLRQALVLGVEQSVANSTTPVSPEARAAANKIEETFRAVPCG